MRLDVTGSDEFGVVVAPPRGARARRVRCQKKRLRILFPMQLVSIA